MDKFCVLFLAPVDKEAMVAPLQKASDTGLPIITNDTFIGDGDYANGPVTFPLSYIGSDNVLGGEIACDALAAAIGETGKVYIQNVKPGISTTDQREEGCKKALAKYPDIELVGVDYNGDDPTVAQTQTDATLQRVPDLAGIFGCIVYSAQGAGQSVQNQGLGDQVSVVAFDATESAIEQLRSGVVDLVIAQMPADMGYLAVITHPIPIPRRATTLGMPVTAKATLTAQQTGTWTEAMRQPSRQISAEADLTDPAAMATPATVIFHVIKMSMAPMPPCSSRILAEASSATPVLHVQGECNGAFIYSFVMRKRT